MALPVKLIPHILNAFKHIKNEPLKQNKTEVLNETVSSFYSFDNVMYKLIIPIVFACFLLSCGQKNNSENDNAKLDALAEKYVRLGLAIGQYDPDFVDAYYGPDSLKPVVAKDTAFPAGSLLKVIDNMSAELKTYTATDSRIQYVHVPTGYLTN